RVRGGRGRSVHLPLARTGDRVLLRVHQADGPARSRGAGPGLPLRSALIPRHHPRAGAPATRPAAKGGPGRARRGRAAPGQHSLSSPRKLIFFFGAAGPPPPTPPHPASACPPA